MNFKKFTAIAVVGLTLVAALIGCADQKKEDNTFTVGFDQDFPPFGYVDEDGGYTGFDIEMAEEYMAYGSRVDIDDYNRNTHQGLHVTSMAAAWMNIVYGFGGMRTDGDILTFAPKMPTKWEGYSFTIVVRNSILRVNVDKKKAIFTNLKVKSNGEKIIVFIPA